MFPIQSPTLALTSPRPLSSSKAKFSRIFQTPKDHSAAKGGRAKEDWQKVTKSVRKSDKTWWTFRIFLFFFARGRGRGESEAPGGGRATCYGKSQEGGGLPGGWGRGGGRGAGRVFAGNLRGRLDFFFRGRNVHRENGYQKVTETENLPPFAYPLLRHIERKRLEPRIPLSLWCPFLRWGFFVDLCQPVPSVVRNRGHFDPETRTPPSKNITGSFFVCGINLVGVTRKIGNMVTGNNFWGINSMGLPESLAGSQCGVRRCELVMNQDYRKYW